MIPVSKPFIGEEEKQAVMAVLDSGMIVQGPRVAEFEKQFAAVCGTKHAVATSSGTTALHLAMLAHGIGPGDEVITSPFTFIASVNSILYAGATPVLVDIEADTFNMDPEAVERAITPKTKAILCVHLFGHLCDMIALQAIADKHRLVIIEDACQSVGGAYQGKIAGSFGTGTFSLYATKNVMSVEGGMITTDDDHIADQCRLLRSHGMRRRYYYDMLGYNFRMTDLHAAVGIPQLNRLDATTKKRQENAAYLSARLESVVVPTVREGYEHVWHQYTIRVDGGRDRAAAVQQLADNGVGSGIFYPVPAHQHDYMREVVGNLTFPIAEQMAAEVISLPVHPQLSQADLEKIVAEVNKL